MGRTPPKFSRIQSDDPVLNRVQDQLAEQNKLLLNNPALAMRDWRFAQVGTSIYLQYRTPPNTWTNVAQPIGSVGPAGPAGLSADVPWCLATKPATADARDDEFESAALNAAWTVVGTTRDGAPGLTQAVSTAAHYRSSHNSQRPSWYMVQSNTANATTDLAGSIYKTITFVAGEFVWCKFSSNAGSPPSTNIVRYDGFVGLQLASDAALTQSIYIDWNYTTAGSVTAAKGGTGTGNAYTDYGIGTASSVLIHPARTGYFGIYRDGDDAWFYVGVENGSWNRIYVGTNWFNFTPTIVRLTTGNANASTPARVAGWDFVRFRSDGVLP